MFFVNERNYYICFQGEPGRDGYPGGVVRYILSIYIKAYFINIYISALINILKIDIVNVLS